MTESDEGEPEHPRQSSRPFPQFPQDSAAASSMVPSPRPRIFPWVFLAVQVLFLLWAIVGGPVDAEDCDLPSQAECQAGTGTETVVTIVAIVLLWVVVDVVLLVFYAIHRRSRRR